MTFVLVGAVWGSVDIYMSFHVGEKHGRCDQKNKCEIKLETIQMVSDGSIRVSDDKN